MDIYITPLLEMYVYVKEGRIRMRSEKRMKAPGCKEYITNHKMTDRLIYEGGEVKIYEQSNQYIEDTNRYHLQKELQREKKKNEDLTRIANNKVSKELELETKNEEVSEYHRKLYLLKHIKAWSQHSWWQENG